MKTIRGTVSKIRIIKMTASPLVYFKLGETNCLIAAHSLSFLAEAAEGCEMVVGGKFNSRNQFVCRRYAVIGKPQIVIEYEKSMYPHRKRV
ncbi:hypothetical protein [Enterococcus diestrammenae]|uniref:hypothetical protein n=1 Tax=Enterococcus diestrammenae TaxID=1155073 RepID=UPI0022DF35BB|nr:hypothetical protein [Enterococcus diestrammenae]